jgi:hypothetical protein
MVPMEIAIGACPSNGSAVCMIRLHSVGRPGPHISMMHHTEAPTCDRGHGSEPGTYNYKRARVCRPGRGCAGRSLILSHRILVLRPMSMSV